MEKKIYFPTLNGISLCGILSEPIKKSTSIVVMCHGFLASKNSPTHTKMQEIFNSNGISTICFDFFGHGESEGDISKITVSKIVQDVLFAIKYCKERGYTKIGLAASSFGCLASIIAASKTNDLVAMAFRSPISDCLEIIPKQIVPKWKKDGIMEYTSNGAIANIGYGFFEDIENGNKGYDVAKKIKVPVLIIHGQEDNIVPISQSEKISAIMKDCTLIKIEGCKHSYTESIHFEGMINLTTRFLINEITQ